MTFSKLQSLTARVDRLELIVRCLKAFDHCYYSRDLERLEQDLQAAMDTQPEEFLPQQP